MNALHFIGTHFKSVISDKSRRLFPAIDPDYTSSSAVSSARISESDLPAAHPLKIRSFRAIFITDLLTPEFVWVFLCGFAVVWEWNSVWWFLLHDTTIDVIIASNCMENLNEKKRGKNTRETCMLTTFDGAMVSRPDKWMVNLLHLRESARKSDAFVIDNVEFQTPKYARSLNIDEVR